MSTFRLVPRITGKRLKQLRIDSGLTVAEVARVYAGGATPDRIRDLESRALVSVRFEIVYRTAVASALFLKTGRTGGSDFENLKMIPSAGR